eukprot:570840-Pelagomonas_calceolata.AAC.3
MGGTSTWGKVCTPVGIRSVDQLKHDDFNVNGYTEPWLPVATTPYAFGLWDGCQRQLDSKTQ